RAHEERERHRPDEVVDRAPGVEPYAEELDRRDVRHPGVLAEELHVAEEEVDREPPGDGRDRQVVPGEPQGNGAEEERNRRHEGPAPHKRRPRRGAVLRREYRRRVRGETGEHLLPEGHHAGDAGEEHQAEGDHGGERDVIEQRHLEVGDEKRRGGDEDEKADERRAGRNHSSSSSSTCRERSDSHTSGGMMTAKTMVSLNALDQNEAYASSSPRATAPSAASG